MWRSPEELADTPEFREFVEREFPAGASELLDSSRRGFLKIMGAGLALAGAATIPGCRRPDHKILPYSREVPEDSIIGKPLFFATSMPLPGGYAEGLLVETHDGRPTKIEGSPLHPANRGKSSVWSQASILGMYDPDRVKAAVFSGRGQPEPATTKDFCDWWLGNSGLADAPNLQARFDASQGQGLAILIDRSTSPSRRALRDALRRKWPRMLWAVHEPASRDEVLDGARRAFGRPLRQMLRLREADVIASFGRDFLESSSQDEPMGLAQARDFAHKRRPMRSGDPMNRLYMVESLMTCTGSLADHRLAVAPSQIGKHMLALASALGVQGVEVPDGANTEWIGVLADDLRSAGPRGLVLVGADQPPEIQALGHMINQRLGAIGRTVQYIEVDPATDEASDSDGAKLVADAIDAERVDTLICINTNPVYDAPPELGFAERMAKVARTITMTCEVTETAEASTWRLGKATFLESWGDTQAFDGTIAPVQPMIAPLYGPSFSEIELLGWLLADERFVEPNNDGKAQSLPDSARLADGYRIVKHVWRETGVLGQHPTLPARPILEGDNGANEQALASWDARIRELDGPESAFTKAWMRVLHDGVVASSQATPVAPGRLAGAMDGSRILRDAARVARLDAPTGESLDLLFYTGPIGDGRFANMAWLQELPHASTRVVWDNPLVISPRTARSLGLSPGSYTRGQKPMARVATMRVGDRTMDIPVWIMPGMADGVVGAMLGYGRTGAGAVGEKVGFNTYAIRTRAARSGARGVKLARAGRRYFIASTQNHWSLEGRTSIFRQIDKKWFDKHAEDNKVKPDEIYGIYESRLSVGERIDGGELTHTPPNITSYSNPFNASPAGPDMTAKVRDRLGRERLPEYAIGPQWGMTIDQSSCTGCGVCTIACQSENNIPSVGKTEVAKGREMQWIRVDRYYTGDIENPDSMLHQPIACLQCENAPCEVVCPVNATIHGPEGLNMMVYNRCIGTRYCSNNCPYKVRRFNFFDWAQTKFNGTFAGEDILGRPENVNLIPPRLRARLDEVSKMRQNPDVTIRPRGVMEKCTYCVQRINRARYELKLQDIKLDEMPDGFFQTACQQACPSDAIVFGNLLDNDSQIHKTFENTRGYLLLGYLNTRPRTAHLIRVRNPNERMLRLTLNEGAYRERVEVNPVYGASKKTTPGSTGAGVRGASRDVLDRGARPDDPGHIGSLRVLSSASGSHA